MDTSSEQGTNREVTVKMNLDWRTGLLLKPKTQQRVRNASNLIAMALWLHLQNWFGGLPAQQEGLRRPPMRARASGPCGSN
jgi:hypothetical protein